MNGNEAVAPVWNYDPNWDRNPKRGCAGQDPKIWFPVEVDKNGNETDNEPVYASPNTKRICDQCEVKADCLEFALATDQPAGIWGGMTTYERQLIKKPKQRKSCPDCGSIDVVTQPPSEICLACGISWAIW